MLPYNLQHTRALIILRYTFEWLLSRLQCSLREAQFSGSADAYDTAEF